MLKPEKLDKAVIDAVTGRRSIRRFLPKAVNTETVEAILNAAARAPSGTNIQPWQVHVVVGSARERLSAAARKAGYAGQFEAEYEYVPRILEEPYRSRRRKVGFDLYALYGIAKEDMAGRNEAMLRNYDFFGAPVGLFFTMERSMAKGAWLDCGMFMQNVMVVSRAYGLETCPQQAWCDIGPVVHAELGIPQDHIVLSGMALGYEDLDAPENRLVTERVAARDFTTWHQ